MTDADWCIPPSGHLKMSFTIMRMAIDASHQMGYFNNAIHHHDGCRLVHPAMWDIEQFWFSFMMDVDWCIPSCWSFTMNGYQYHFDRYWYQSFTMNGYQYPNFWYRYQFPFVLWVPVPTFGTGTNVRDLSRNGRFCHFSPTKLK